MAKPKQWFETKETSKAKKAAKERGLKMWRFDHRGFLGSGYYIGKKLPRRITDCGEAIKLKEMKV